MLMADRRCALLKDRTIPRMPRDLVGRVYEPVDLDDPETVIAAIHTWIREDLALGDCPRCRYPC